MTSYHLNLGLVIPHPPACRVATHLTRRKILQKIARHIGLSTNAASKQGSKVSLTVPLFILKHSQTRPSILCGRTGQLTSLEKRPPCAHFIG